MPTPVLSPITSILAITRGRFYSLQLALGSGSPAATSWSLASGGFPDGMTVKATSGRTTGTPSPESEGSMFVAMIAANNASGPSMSGKLVFGITHGRVVPDGSLESILDLSMSGIGFPGQDQTDDLGRSAVPNEFEPESRILLNPSGHLPMQGIEDTARWIPCVGFSGPALNTMLGHSEADAVSASPLWLW